MSNTTMTICSEGIDLSLEEQMAKTKYTYSYGNNVYEVHILDIY